MVYWLEVIERLGLRKVTSHKSWFVNCSSSERLGFPAICNNVGGEETRNLVPAPCVASLGLRLVNWWLAGSAWGAQRSWAELKSLPFEEGPLKPPPHTHTSGGDAAVLVFLSDRCHGDSEEAGCRGLP